MNSVLTHAGKCGGNIYPEVVNLFSIKTPSLVISPRGISLGPLEINFKGGGTVSLECSKCNKTIRKENYAEEIMVECNICHEKHSAEDSFTSRTISIFCLNCKEYLSGKKPAPDHVQNLLKWLSLPSEDSIKSLVDVLSSKISAGN